MMPPIPSHLSVDKRFELNMWMARNDPDHRKNTRAALGHEPTDEELVQHWLRAGVVGFEKTLSQIAQTEVHA